MSSPLALQGTPEEIWARWTANVEQWCRFVRDGHDVHWDELHGRALLTACGPVSGLRVLDIGCGEGRCARALAERGALVAGIDVCEAMVEKARTHPDQASQQIDFRVMNAVDVHRHVWTVPFGLVTAPMVLHDMPDPAAALAAAAHVLGTRGRMVLSIPHPAWYVAGGEDYFATACEDHAWDVPQLGEPLSTLRWRRSLEEYAGMVRAAGFVIDDMQEPRATPAQIDKHERLSRAGRVPCALILVLSLANSGR